MLTTNQLKSINIFDLCLIMLLQQKMFNMIRVDNSLCVKLSCIKLNSNMSLHYSKTMFNHQSLFKSSKSFKSYIVLASFSYFTYKSQNPIFDVCDIVELKGCSYSKNLVKQTN